MTTTSGADSDDSFWRRPAEPGPDGPQVPASTPDDDGSSTRTPYSGPPPSVAPPAGWRPPVHVQPPPPRQLPRQDLPGLAQEQQSARTLTYGVGLVAGAVLLVVVCLLCSRVLF